MRQAHPGAIILPYLGLMPTIHQDAWIAPGAVVIGDVHIGANTNVWFNTVIRGDVAPIRIGERTNIQDGTVIHVTREIGPTTIGSGITIGHKALIHAATIEDESFVGMGSIVLDFAVIEKGAFLAAGAILTPKKRIPTGQMWAGNPAKYFRDLKQEEKDYIPFSAQHYVNLAKNYNRAARDSDF